MLPLLKISAFAACLASITVVPSYADSKKTIKRDVLRQMVQLSVAYTQARISFTSPPFPVQFVDTSPFAGTAQARSGLQPIVNPNAGEPNNNFFVSEAQHLTAGNYNVFAEGNTYTITNLATGTVHTYPITPNAAAQLPSHSVSGSAVVESNFKGAVFVNYTLKR